MLLATAVLLFGGFDSSVAILDYNSMRTMEYQECHVWRMDGENMNAWCSPASISGLSGSIATGEPYSRVEVFDWKVFYTRTDCYLVPRAQITFSCFTDAVFKGGFE